LLSPRFGRFAAALLLASRLRLAAAGCFLAAGFLAGAAFLRWDSGMSSSLSSLLLASELLASSSLSLSPEAGLLLVGVGCWLLLAAPLLVGAAAPLLLGGFCTCAALAARGTSSSELLLISVPLLLCDDTAKPQGVRVSEDKIRLCSS
jgi:hypothetical protein